MQWPITTNLEAALRYLSYSDVERVLWIDAICIDQSNVEERNHQVPLMKTIYSNADAVQVWLGEPTDGDYDTIALLKGLGQGVPLKNIRIQGSAVKESHLSSLIGLMERPWWERTWTQ